MVKESFTQFFDIKFHVTNFKNGSQGGMTVNGIWWAALAAGAAMALPKQPEHNLMKLPSFQGVAEVRSSLPGRMRLYMPAVSGDCAQAAQMKSQLESTGVIHQVQIEPRTGSVLILYDESQVQAPVVMGAAMKLMGLDGKVNAEPAGKVRQGMRALLRAINAGVLDATGGLLDVQTLAAGTLTVAALRSKAQAGWAVPGAMTLLWWASKLFGVREDE